VIAVDPVGARVTQTGEGTRSVWRATTARRTAVVTLFTGSPRLDLDRAVLVIPLWVRDGCAYAQEPIGQTRDAQGTTTPLTRTNEEQVSPAGTVGDNTASTRDA
jgi:hypothetical protein